LAWAWALHSDKARRGLANLTPWACIAGEQREKRDSYAEKDKGERRRILDENRDSHSEGGKTTLRVRERVWRGWKV